MSIASRPADGGFNHQAYFYAGADAFLAGTVSFVRDGMAAGEPTLVVVDADKIDRLRSELGDDGDAVQFADMADVGRNPARIIPAWVEFVERHGHDRAMRGIGEPIWAERSPAELVECQHHESLLNVAFADAAAFTLLCPYDTRALPPDVMEEARRSHPVLKYGMAERPSRDYRGLEAVAPFEGALPEPPADTEELVFGAGPLHSVRGVVSRAAISAALEPARMSDFVIAVNEVATNSLCHGGGSGALRIWSDESALTCEIRDRGQINQPLVGRERPSRQKEGGRGLWLANQLCDLMQVRSSPSGTTVRLHMWLDTSDVAATG